MGTEADMTEGAFIHMTEAVARSFFGRRTMVMGSPLLFLPNCMVDIEEGHASPSSPVFEFRCSKFQLWRCGTTLTDLFRKSFLLDWSLLHTTPSKALVRRSTPRAGLLRMFLADHPMGGGFHPLIQATVRS